MNRRQDDWSRLRQLPLRQVAARLGYRCDPRDRSRFRREGSILSITGEKFCDHRQGCGGGGAIDLVIHAEGTSFPEAVKRLRQPAGELVPEKAAAPGRELVLPPPADSAWPAIRRRLTRERALPADLVAAPGRRGPVYADARGSAVFLATDRHRKPAGAECRGTACIPGRKRFRGMAPGSRKDRGSFRIGGGPATVDTLFIAGSAIDALSAFAMPGSCRTGCVFLSTCGTASRLPAWAEAWKPARIICGFDADAAGDEAAGRLAASDRRVSRIRPAGGKDWNAILVARRRE